jgi:hypothetical protein
MEPRLPGRHGATYISAASGYLPRLNWRRDSFCRSRWDARRTMQPEGESGSKIRPSRSQRVVGSSSRALSADATVLGLTARPESTCSTAHCRVTLCSRRMVGSRNPADDGRAATTACQQHEPWYWSQKHRRRSCAHLHKQAPGVCSLRGLHPRHRQMRIVLHV